MHAQPQVDNAHCADKIETGIGDDGPVHNTSVYTTHGYSKWWPWAGEKRNRVAYIIPGWAGRMVSKLYISVQLNFTLKLF